MFGLLQNSHYRKPLKYANSLSVQLYVYICVCMSCVNKPEEAYVQKLSKVHMGCSRPKINDAAVVY